MMFRVNEKSHFFPFQVKETAGIMPVVLLRLYIKVKGVGGVCLDEMDRICFVWSSKGTVRDNYNMPALFKPVPLLNKESPCCRVGRSHHK